MTGKKATGVMFLAAVLAMGVASFAWACTKQTVVYAIEPPVGPVKSPVTVQGDGIAPGTPVEVRWNSTTGPVLGVTQAMNSGPHESGAFSVQIIVPETPPGVYYVVAVSGDNSIARSVFQVTGEPSAQNPQATTTATNRSQSDLWAGFSSASSLGEADLAQQATRQGANTALWAGTALLSFTAAFGIAGVLAGRRKVGRRG